MASFKIYKLHFTSPLHVGNLRSDTGTSLRTIHSDTLQAALTACLSSVGVQIPDGGDLGFTVSSLFPYYQKDAASQVTYFMPMPCQIHFPHLDDPTKTKMVKKVQWVDQRLYPKVLHGEKFFEGKCKDMLDNIHGEFLVLPDSSFPAGETNILHSNVVQRASIADRTGANGTEPFFVDRVTFSDRSGLYFLAEGDTTLLDKALGILAGEGVGSYRHVGLGFFEWEAVEKPWSVECPEDADHVVSLSVLIPEDKEQLTQLLASDQVAYDFARRGGWITTEPYNSLRKNAVYAFLPGSVFSRINAGTTTIGRIVNLTPDVGVQTVKHPVYRNGKSIVLPIRILSPKSNS